jgi:hypothetical protein
MVLNIILASNVFEVVTKPILILIETEGRIELPACVRLLLFETQDSKDLVGSLELKQLEYREVKGKCLKTQILHTFSFFEIPMADEIKVGVLNVDSLFILGE